MLEAFEMLMMIDASTVVSFVATADTASSAAHEDTSPAQINAVVLLGSTVVESAAAAAIVIVTGVN